VKLGADEADYSVLDDVKPQDLTKFGLIPEFVGRLPIVVNLDPLDEDALVRILTEPKNAIIKQYQKLVGFDGVKLTVEEDAVREIAQTAIRLKTGARGLRTIIEGVMTEVMYKIPSEEDIVEVIVTKECLTSGEEPKLVYKTGDSQLGSFKSVWRIIFRKHRIRHVKHYHDFGTLGLVFLQLRSYLRS
jgi:ATP-dependent Clp protease ATP-binding subunit ClpX